MTRWQSSSGCRWESHTEWTKLGWRSVSNIPNVPLAQSTRCDDADQRLNCDSEAGALSVPHEGEADCRKAGLHLMWNASQGQSALASLRRSSTSDHIMPPWQSSCKYLTTLTVVSRSANTLDFPHAGLLLGGLLILVIGRVIRGLLQTFWRRIYIYIYIYTHI